MTLEPLRTAIDRESDSYRANYDAMSAAVDRLRTELKRSTLGGGEKYVQRHIERGKLLPRERVELLLDEGSYFLEIAPLAGIGFDDEIPGARVIGGIGLVSGRECMIIANEATAKGGSTGEAGLWKNARLADIARENHLTSILLVESAGADLPVQSKIFVPGGRGFREITRRSKLRIPSISVVFGSSTAGGAYLPGMSDYVVMVKRQAQVFLAGPPLVKMATGEVSTEEELGGAEMHSRSFRALRLSGRGRTGRHPHRARDRRKFQSARSRPRHSSRISMSRLTTPKSCWAWLPPMYAYRLKRGK